MDKNVIIVVISVLVVAVAFYYIEENNIAEQKLSAEELYNFGTLNIVTGDEILGCMDPIANNYNEDATMDMGNCMYYVVGCSDINATNYDPSANYDPNNNLCQYDD